MTWELLWKIVFFFGVGVFAIMTVVVTIGGAKDIKRMLSELKKSGEEE